MADFIYKSGNKHFNEEKFKKLYESELKITDDFIVYYNGETITHLQENGNSITVLGYAYKPGNDTRTYLHRLLCRFTPDLISEIKKELLGQYTLIVHIKNTLYIFSDFLQVRSIFYDTENRLISSSFQALNNTAKDYSMRNKEEYKIFEFLAMRHCLYPVWLGNDTICETIKFLRAYEYLELDGKAKSIKTGNCPFTIDNCKTESLKALKTYTLSALRKAVDHPLYKNKKIYSTLTGGFDSRLVSALVSEYYPDTLLRFSQFKNSPSLDYRIASKVAKKLALPFEINQTDFEMQKDDFYFITDGFSPKENSIITESLFLTGNRDLGFGGAYGTELYSPFAYAGIDELINDYLTEARSFVKTGDPYYDKFRQVLYNEFSDIKKYYILKEYNEKDFIRIFQLLVTGRFSSPLVSAHNIYGNQYEIFGCFPVIEAGLKIPYKYLGDKKTFGRFYLIPKSILETINPKISKIITTHFCPMRPLSAVSFISYAAGKFKRRIYYRKQYKLSGSRNNKVSLKTEHIRYISGSHWYEGFEQNFIRPDGTPG